MSKPHNKREEPKLRIEDLENELNKTNKKKWPVDEGDSADQNVISEEEITGILDHPSYQELEKKLNDTEEQLNEARNENLRAQAEVNNILRRKDIDVKEAHKYALKKFSEELLPVVDSLDKALESDVHNNEYAKKIHEGIELTMSLLLKTMEKFGIKQIDPKGHEFNPELHQAIATQAMPGIKSNTIIEVLQKGYILNDRLIRPALVVVSA